MPRQFHGGGDIFLYIFMTQYNKQFGAIGEVVAQSYLEEHGFTILDRNVCFWGGELDIVAKKDDCIHFVEVKTRASETYLPLEQSLSIRQIRVITRTAERYLAMKDLDDINWQIDLIAIVICGNWVRKVEYFEDIDL